MALWGNNDDAANSALFATMQVNEGTTTANQTALFNNTTANDFFTGATVGQFAIDADEQQQSVTSSTERPTHAGWVLRTEGSGGRAGRVFYETLVAMGSMQGDSSNTVLPQQAIVVTTAPVPTSANSSLVANNAYFSVVASLVPPGGSITFKWQVDGVNITDGAVYANSATPILDVLNTSGLDGTLYRVTLSKAGAATVNTTNVALTVTT